MKPLYDRQLPMGKLIPTILLAITPFVLIPGCSGKSSDQASEQSATVDSHPTTTVTTPKKSATTGQSGLVLTSNAFTEGTSIPVKYTCKGDNISPSLSWSGAPSGTASYALIIDDEDAPCGKEDNACKHWQIYNIPASKNSLAEGEKATSTTGISQGINWDASQDYSGPCPPTQHTYRFTVYALSESMPLMKDKMSLTRSQFSKLYSPHILASATLSGWFSPDQ